MAQLNRQQAAWLHKVLSRQLGNLQILRTRMMHGGIDPTDLIFQRLLQSCDALQSLTIEAHYRSLEGGIGRTDHSAQATSEPNP